MRRRYDLDACYERSARFWTLWKLAYEATSTPAAREALNEALGLAAQAFHALEVRAKLDAERDGRYH